MITLDGADPALVRRWAAAGELPHVQRLLAQGTAAPVVATPGVFVSSNWPSIMTGVGPDRHGYLCWDDIDPATYEHGETDPNPETIAGVPLWTHLDRAGRRTALVDVPHTWPEPIDGVMVVEWGCHDRHQGPRSHPPELLGELDALTGGHLGSGDHPTRHQFAPCDYLHRAGPVRTVDEDRLLLDELRVAGERKRDASLHLLDRGGWDVFWTVLGETHCVGHQLWHHHDTSHPRHDPAAVELLGGDPVLDVYRRADAALGDHLERAGADTTTYLLLPHGMVAHHDGTDVLDPLLANLERSLDEPDLFGRSTRFASLASGPLPLAGRRRLGRVAAPLVRRRLASAPAPLDTPLPPLADRRWYAVPNNSVIGGVRLNLAGREGDGRIHPGARDEVLRWLTDRLGELVNVDTGGPVVARVVPVDDVYDRTPADRLPDLFVEWVRTDAIERVWSPATGTVVRPYTHWRTGDHVPEGLLVAVGPGIGAGVDAGAIDSIDVGTTVARSVGVAVPDVEGRPVAGLLPADEANVGRVGEPRWADDRARHGLRRALHALEHRAATGRAQDVHRWDVADHPELLLLRRELDALAAAHHVTRGEAVEARREAGAARGEAAHLRNLVRDLTHEVEVGRTMAWIRQQPTTDDVLVSVVMPTRDRSSVIGRAIASVLAQSHRNWELLVVDDDSTDGTAALLDAIDDPRVRCLQSEGRGSAAARNVGLDAARGELVTYLDDDNTFDPEWLKSVVWAFGQRPGESVGYGARLVDDFGRHHGGEPSGTVWIQQLEWDREAVKEFNRIDMNVLAHRRGDVRFDGELSFYADWDVLLSLTVDEDPFPILAVAAHYTTDAPHRLTTDLRDEQRRIEYERIKAKVRTPAARVPTT